MVSAGYDSSVLSSRDDGRNTDPDTGMLSIGAREVVPDLCSKCEPAVRRILNRALFTHITNDDEENAPDIPDETTASVLAHTTIDAPAHVTAETKLPRHQAGQFSIFSSYVEHRGFEPLTYCLQSSRATNCANAPWTRTV